MDLLGQIALWVLGSVAVGITAGFYLGRTVPHRSEAELTAERERKATLSVLTEILGSVERMTGQVEGHNTEIQQTAHDVGELCSGGEMESIKQTLLEHIGTLLKSNQRLQSDLTYSRYRME